jgi:hypothetical protein
MKDIYNLCFYGGMTLAIILLITSIVLFIVFKIPKVIGDLTGRNARREIAEKKKKKGGTEKSNSSRILKQEQKKYYNQDTGKITIRDSATNEDVTRKITSNVDPATIKSVDIKPEERETDILRPEDEYDINDISAAAGEEETTVLDNSEAETDVLRPNGSKGKEYFDDDFDPDGETDVLKAESDGLEEGSDDDDFDPDAETDVLRSTDRIVAEDDDETAVLKASNEDEETVVLRSSDKKDDGEAATTILSGEKKESATSLPIADDINNTEHIKGVDKKRYIYDVVVVHTEESL